MISVSYMKLINFMAHNEQDDGECKITALNLKVILIPFQCCFLCLYHKRKKNPHFSLNLKLSLNFFWRQINAPF